MIVLFFEFLIINVLPYEVSVFHTVLSFPHNVFAFPRVLDHDTYSAHDAIGKVYIDLNPLLNRKKGSLISGWYPIYDTMHGTKCLC